MGHRATLKANNVDLAVLVLNRVNVDHLRRHALTDDTVVLHVGSERQKVEHELSGAESDSGKVAWIAMME